LLLPALAVPACQSSSTPLPYIPITGVVVPAARIVAGYGCGTGAGQVYKYAVVVSQAAADGGPTSPISIGVFDCFADGVIENLDAGSMNYVLQVYAYNSAGYPSCLVGVCVPSDAGYAGGPCYPTRDSPSGLASLAGEFAAAAQWQTTCTASQQQGAPTSASCGPLELPPAPADGGATASIVCGDSGPDSGDDGSSGDAPADDVVKPDASADGGASDAGADGTVDADAAVEDATVGDQASPTDAAVDVAAD
jgi:hypothetical protein